MDNHVSMPQWCCGESDDNGFFGDKYFDPKEWLHGLAIVANRFKGKPQLNPKLLVIISGLSCDTDLSFVRNETLNINFDNKLVYKGHWYAFTDGRRKDWEPKTPDQICATTMKEFDAKLEFVTLGKNPIPLFLSEFGEDQGEQIIRNSISQHNMKILKNIIVVTKKKLCLLSRTVDLTIVSTAEIKASKRR
ncbi:hypothetical protein MKX01_000727 [Papaver californicum]|nr:hypothetical protein MKX01_000727 [Papaver californicum]